MAETAPIQQVPNMTPDSPPPPSSPLPVGLPPPLSTVPAAAVEPPASRSGAPAEQPIPAQQAPAPLPPAGNQAPSKSSKHARACKNPASTTDDIDANMPLDLRSNTMNAAETIRLLKADARMRRLAPHERKGYRLLSYNQRKALQNQAIIKQQFEDAARKKMQSGAIPQVPDAQGTSKARGIGFPSTIPQMNYKERNLEGFTPPTGAKFRSDYDRSRLGGDIPVYENPNDLDEECKLYFYRMEEQKRPYTLSGLVFFLGFAHRKDLEKYEEKPGFSSAISRAKNLIEMQHHELLLVKEGSTRGIEFDLEVNHKWERVERRDITSGGKPIGQVSANPQELALGLATMGKQMLDCLKIEQEERALAAQNDPMALPPQTGFTPEKSGE